MQKIKQRVLNTIFWGGFFLITYGISHFSGYLALVWMGAVLMFLAYAAA